MTRVEFGQRLKALRKAKKLDQLALALQTGYENSSAISKIEKGQVDVPLSSIIAFAEALDVPLSAFFYCDDTIEVELSVIKDIHKRSQAVTEFLQAIILLDKVSRLPTK